MKTALLGYGVVGSGVHALAEARPEHGITISRVLVRRDIAPIRAIATRDFQEIVSDPSIETVVEVMGGEEPALTYVKAALAAKKHVVTANKLMLSLHYEELLALARANGVRLAFSAAVGGGIPWLANLLRVSRVDRIASLGGIMNGTTNFILTAMQQGGADFAETLATAQKLGYAEADPTADIDGLDVRAKLALSCDAAFAQMADASAIPTLGIRYITAADVAQFHALGLTCRLIGKAERTEAGVAAYVEPMLFAADAPEAGVNGTGNIISYCCEGLGSQSFFGLGAGQAPTASAVMQDLIDVSCGATPFSLAHCEGTFVPDASKASHSYYLRTSGALPEGCIDRMLGQTPAGAACITAPMPVSALHALVQARLAAQESVFAAGLASLES